MYGIAVCLVMRNRSIWAEAPYILIRPGKIFFVLLKATTWYPPKRTLLGDVDFPEYMGPPPLDQLRNPAARLIDYFGGNELPAPADLLYIKTRRLQVRYRSVFCVR